MKLKRDAKFGEESTCRLKIGISNLTNFDPSTSKVSKIFILMGSFWAKYIFFEIKKYRGIIFHETEGGYKTWRGIDLSFQNWHKKFHKFWSEHFKSLKKIVLIGFLWPKNVLFELQRYSYRQVIFHDTEELCNFWRKTD